MPPTNGSPLGIDVSSNQGAVDWNAVSQANISFAYVRASLGAHSADSQFAGNWSRLRGTGLLRGAYHFFWPLASATDQASHYIDVVGNLMPGDLPPMIDLEPAHIAQNPNQDVWSTVPPDNRLPMILGWLSTVEHAFGLKPFVYTRVSSRVCLAMACKNYPVIPCGLRTTLTLNSRTFQQRGTTGRFGSFRRTARPMG